MGNENISLLGTNIKKFRNKKKMSMDILSKLSGVSSSSISQIETGGRSSMRSENVEKIAKALEITTNDLLLTVEEGEYEVSDIYEAIVMCLADDEVSIDDIIMSDKEKEQFEFGVKIIINTIRSNRK